MVAITLRVLHSGQILPLQLNGSMIIGRSDDGSLTGLDLGPYQGAEMGVSRQHATLRWSVNQLILRDLNSANGTRLNGVALTPEIDHPVKSEDRIAFGAFEVSVKIMHTAPTQSNIVAMRKGIELLNAPPRGNGQLILIVDDDLNVTTLLRTILEQSGYITMISQDVVNAIKVLQQAQPSLVTVDMRMVGVHGMELCRYIRRDAPNPNTPIVVLSALSDQEVVNNALAAGVDLYLSKPIQRQEFLRVVGSLVQAEEQGKTVQTKQLSTGALPKETREQLRANDHTLVIYVDGRREPINVVVDKTLTLGRKLTSAQETDEPHINLDSFGGFDKGVSRRHVRIERQGLHFILHNMNSTNGTFINGQKMTGDGQHTLKSGDEVYLGSLGLRIYLTDADVPVEE